MPKLIVLIPLLAAPLLIACGQKGPLYIPPQQQTAASAPPAAAEEIDARLDEAQPPPAASQDQKSPDQTPERATPEEGSEKVDVDSDGNNRREAAEFGQ